MLLFRKRGIIYAFLIDYTYSSNAIEGNTLTLGETALVLSGLTIGEKPLKDHLEATGHRDAFLCLENDGNLIPMIEIFMEREFDRLSEYLNVIK